MDEMRANFLGDRLVSVGIGSAPSTPEMRQFVVDCFQVPLRDGYGLTEAGGGVMNSGKLSRPPITDYKLRDVPELGYYTTDKPYPRGELCLKSSLVSPGYFKKPEATAKLFDAEGWLLTGDIMEERGPDELVYLDRANDVMKLSQGEFVSIGMLGRIFEKTCPVIQQISLYGNSARSFLLAVVVPDMEVAAARLGRTPDESDLRAMIRAEMKEAAVSEDLR